MKLGIKYSEGGKYKGKLQNYQLRLYLLRNPFSLVSDGYIINILTPNVPIPTLTIRYYSHKKWAGLYYSHTNECVICLRSHQTIQQMIDTILHEMTHCSQNYQIKDFNRLFDDQISKVGYFECKYEREARALSRLHGKACLLWVCQRLVEKTA